LNWLAVMLAIIAWTGLVEVGFAQSTNSGDIRGIVTDVSGAVLPDVTVTVVNTNTGVTKTLTTNQDGLYDTSSIVAGTYEITFAKTGFQKLVRSSISLPVGQTTVNAQLNVGSVTEQVVVTTDIPLLATENGQQSTTLEAKQMAELPNVGQNWENFTVLLPGTTGTASAPMGNSPGQSVASNGNLPYSSMLADGATSTLSHSANGDVSVFETVQEVQVSTSAFSAQYGIGGIIYNQISKGGTSSFHGSLYEYWQNDALNAHSYFQRTGPVPHLRYNNYGGSIGGPILKKKMFFFFNFDKTVNNGSSSGLRTVPTLAMRSGDFTGLPTIYDPATQTIVNGKVQRQSFAAEYGQGNTIPTARFDKVAAAIQANYPLPNVPGTVSNGVTSNNYTYTVLSPNPFTKYFGRLDYDINPSNRLTMSVTQRDNPATYTNENTCPINCFTGDVDSTNAQISDVWNIGARTINEARIGYTKQLNFFIPYSLGQGFPAKLGLQFAKADLFPTVNISQIYSLSPGTNAVYKEHVFDPSDVVTMIRGKHILHFGGEYLIYQDNSTNWGNINAATVGYTGVYTQSTTGDSASGVAYADFLLGQTQSWSASQTPEYAARQKSPQMFIQDDFKVLPNLTLNLGLRYQIQQGWSDAKKNQRTFDPTIVNPATGTLGALWYPANADNGRTSLQATVWNTFLPRVGFAYQPHPDTVIRGGFGLYAYGWSLDTYGSGQGSAFGSQGNATDQTNGVTPAVILSSSGANLPYTPASTSKTAQNGQGTNYNQYHTPVAKIYQWNLAVQKQLGTDMSVEVAYVASHGFNLNFPVDINQVPENRLAPVDTQFRPYPQYNGIGGSTNNAVSNYNSLQTSVQKRLTHGLSFNANYTWSHFLDDIDSSGWGSRGGTQTYQRAYDHSANYGPSNFDVRNAFKGNVVYVLPFGKGAQFLNNNWLVDQVIGGWRASSTFVLQSGNPFTPVIGGSNNSYSQAGQWYPNVIGNPNLPNRSVLQWYNNCTLLANGTYSAPTCNASNAAWAVPTAATFGNSHRNSLVGPGLVQFNMSLAKTFHIWENANLQIKADAVNVLNHASFGVPGRNVNQNNASISSTTVGGRNMQLGARLTF
jgi:hypothetical protein